MFLTSKKPLNEWLLKWCRVSESNQGHRDFQSLALPTELTRHVLFNFKKTKSANYCKNPFSVCPKYQKHILKSSKFQKFIDRLEILHTKTNKSAFRGSIFLKAF